MRFKISRKNILDDCILLILLLNVMILRWLGFQSAVNDIITFLICLDLLLYRKNISKNIILSFSLLCVYLLLQFFIFPGSLSLFLRNIYRSVRGLLIIIYFSQLVARKPGYVEKFFYGICVPVNLYMLINIPFLLLQSNGMISLAARDISRSVTHIRVDYYSGLFGLYGTPCLAAFSTFLLIYNTVYLRKYRRKGHKADLALLSIFFLIFFLIFSVINDNKFFYVELAMYSLIVYFASVKEAEDSQKNRGNRRNALIRLILIVILTAAAFVIAYQNSSSFHALVDLFIKKIKEGLNYTNVRGGGERIGSILYMLHSDSMLFGYGLAKLRLETGVGALGFVHLSSADLGTMFAMGGLIYIVLEFVIIYFCFKRNFYKSRVPLFLTIAFLIMTSYTNSLYNTSTTISLALN